MSDLKYKNKLSNPRFCIFTSLRKWAELKVVIELEILTESDSISV